MSEKEEFKIGSPVWGKVKGSLWPGKIVAPEMKIPASKKSCLCVYFFGSKNYALLEPSVIKPYEEYKEIYIEVNKSAPFREAINAIEEYIKNEEGCVNSTKEPSEDLFDQIKDTSESLKLKRKNEMEDLGEPLIKESKCIIGRGNRFEGKVSKTRKKSNIYRIVPKSTEGLNLANAADRRKTYRNFLLSSLTDRLIASGFYYSGHCDIVICFKCGLRLCNLLSIDDPALLHLNRAKNCPLASSLQEMVNEQKLKESSKRKDKFFYYHLNTVLTE